MSPSLIYKGASTPPTQPTILQPLAIDSSLADIFHTDTHTYLYDDGSKIHIAYLYTATILFSGQVQNHFLCCHLLEVAAIIIYFKEVDFKVTIYVKEPENIIFF